MRVATVAIVVLLGLGGAWSQPPAPPTPAVITVGELTIAGDVKNVLVVNKFPITVTAPQDGGALHWWQFPDGVMGVDKGDSLEIASAPLGEVNVTVRYAVAVIDWEKKTFRLVNKTLSSTFMNGIPPPGPQPPPTPDVPAALMSSLKAAYSADRDGNKDALVHAMASALRDTPAVLEKSGKIRSHKDFFDRMKANVMMALDDPSPTPKVIPAMRMAAGAYLSSVLSTDPNALCDVDYWTAAKKEHALVAAAFETLIKEKK